MSLVKSKAIQLGFDATPTNNFLIYQPLTPDGTFRIANGNQGATTDIMTVTSGGSVTFAGTTNFSSLNFGAGSESAPSLFPTGDSNTGIWFPAADTFAVSTGGTERIRIDSSGNLSLGANSVGSGIKLDVVGSIRAYAANQNTSINVGRSGDAIYYNAINIWSGYNPNVPSHSWSQQSGQANYNFSQSLTFNGWTSGTSYAERLRIDTSGNVGIGIIPAYRLDVASTTLPAARITSSYVSSNQTFSSLLLGTSSSNQGSGFGHVYDSVTPANSYAHITPFGANEGTALAVRSNGYVGLGVSTPSAKLDVNATNPSRGIITVLRNPASSGWTGAMIHLVQNGLEDWVLGCVPGETSFGIWSGRNNSNDGTQLLKITSSTNGGYVGIGTSPTMPVHIKKDWVNGLATFGIQSATAGGNTGIGLFNSAVARVGYMSYDTNTSTFSIANQLSGNLILGTNDTSQVYINSNGNVGIGRPTASQKLDVGGIIAINGIAVTQTQSSTNNSVTYGMIGSHGGGGAGCPGAIRSIDIRAPYPGDFPAYAIVGGFTSWDLNNSAPYADFINFGTYNDSSGGQPNIFLINKDTAGVKISRGGWDGYNTMWASTKYASGSIYTLNYTSASDATVKENVQTITNGLSIVNALRPVTFEWTDEYILAGLSKNESEKEVDDTDKFNRKIKIPAQKVTNVGLIAQEVEEVLPTVVMHDNISLPGHEEYLKNLAYEKLVPHLIAAVQELSKQNDELKARLDAAGL